MPVWTIIVVILCLTDICSSPDIWRPVKHLRTPGLSVPVKLLGVLDAAKFLVHLTWFWPWALNMKWLWDWGWKIILPFSLSSCFCVCLCVCLSVCSVGNLAQGLCMLSECFSTENNSSPWLCPVLQSQGRQLNKLTRAKLTLHSGLASLSVYPELTGAHSLQDTQPFNVKPRMLLLTYSC